MSPREYRRNQKLRRLTENLSRNAFANYRRVLARLLEIHRADYLQPLSDAVRHSDWKRVYAIADSLSKQKYTDASSHFVANQFALLIKKYPWDCSLIGTDPEGQAVKSFLSAEKRCGLVNRKFDFFRTKDPSRDLFRKEGGVARKWIRDLIGNGPNYAAIARQCEFGSGASVGIHGCDTHIAVKLSADRWTVTPGAIHHAFAGLMRNHHYLEALLPHKDYGDGTRIFCLDYEKAFDSYISRLDVIEYNKLSFVPKTAKTHRSIAVEPMLNGFYQKGIDEFLRERLRRVNLDLRDQEPNQKMACSGSLDDSPDGFVTIDLKNASNSNAWGPVRYLYSPKWCDILNRTRSPCYTYNGGDPIRYNMLSSMGNGFTFPIQTITFSAICVASGAGVPNVDFRVYGDDIIVRRKHAMKVVAMLRHYGFQLNEDKTFLEGPFRESCGADWFNGEDVRPFTLDFALDSVQCVFKFLNLTQQSDRTSQFFAPVRQLVMSLLDAQFRFIRPLRGEVDSGIDSLGDEHLSVPSCRFIRETARWEWLELVTSPVIDYVCLERVRGESWLTGIALRGNPSIRSDPRPQGHRKADLGGSPEVTVRYKTLTKIVRKSYSSTSNWLPTDCPDMVLPGFRRCLA